MPPDEVAVIDRMIGAAHEPVTASRRLITRRGTQDPPRRDQEVLDLAAPTAINHPQLRITQRHRLSVWRAPSLHAIMLPGSEAALHIGGRDPVWRVDQKAALAEVRAERRERDEALAGRGVEAFGAAAR